MFRGLINDAKSAVGSVVARYATRAAVVGLFLLALGFATAAVAIQLVQMFGAIDAYWMLAGAFTLLGVIAAIVVSWQERKEEVVDATASDTDTSAVSTEAAAQAAAQLPIALLGSVLTTPAGPASLAGLVRFVGRNISLVVFLALIAFLFWPNKFDKAASAGEPEQDPDTQVPEQAMPT